MSDRISLLHTELNKVNSASGKTQLVLQMIVNTSLALCDVPECNAAKEIIQERIDEYNDVNAALQNIGIRKKKERRSIVFCCPDGRGEAHRLTRRLAQICRAMVAERWSIARDAEKLLYSEARGSSSGILSERLAKRRGGSGWFSNDERRQFSLEEAQQVALDHLFSNLHIATPIDFDSFDHTLSYALPGLIDSLSVQQRPPVGLIIVDDLPILIAEALEANKSSKIALSILRARLVCEVADKLKRLAVQCGSPPAVNGTASAIIVVNHVADISDKERELLLPIVEKAISTEEGTPSHSRYHGLLSTTTDLPSCEAPLVAAEQEMHLSGVLAHLNNQVLCQAQSILDRFDSSGTDSKAILRDKLINGVLSQSFSSILGFAWLNCINTRIVLMQLPCSVRVPAKIFSNDTTRPRSSVRYVEVGLRRAVVVQSPSTASGRASDPGEDFLIVSGGILAHQKLIELYGGEGHRTGDKDTLSSEVHIAGVDDFNRPSRNTDHPIGEESQLWSLFDGEGFDEVRFTQMLDEEEARITNATLR